MVCSLLGFITLAVRRNVIGGELGGPKKSAYASSAFLVFLWFVYIILAKELLLVLGVILFILFYPQNIIQPTLLGKLTTTMQMLFIVWLFACYFFGWMPIKTYWVMLSLLLCLVVATLCQYIRIGISLL